VAKKNADTLKETAREIGATLGEVHVKARSVVEGVKAAVKASRAAYAGGAKRSAKKKAGSARPRKTR
jgi:hypothetical protein